MTQINLKTTLYLVLISALGVVLPWTSANADLNCGQLNITGGFKYGNNNPVSCTAVFTCTGTGAKNCWTDFPPLVVKTSDLTCTRVISSTTTQTTRSCKDSPNSSAINYNPSTGNFTDPIAFPGYLSSPTTGMCNCQTITLDPGPLVPGKKNAHATGCKIGSSVGSPTYQVFPALAGSSGTNFDFTYTIETKDSPNCPK